MAAAQLPQVDQRCLFKMHLQMIQQFKMVLLLQGLSLQTNRHTQQYTAALDWTDVSRVPDFAFARRAALVHVSAVWW